MIDELPKIENKGGRGKKSGLHKVAFKLSPEVVAKLDEQKAADKDFNKSAFIDESVNRRFADLRDAPIKDAQIVALQEEVKRLQEEVKRSFGIAAAFESELLLRQTATIGIVPEKPVALPKPEKQSFLGTCNRFIMLGRTEIRFCWYLLLRRHKKEPGQ